jgi:hypothetical protein
LNVGGDIMATKVYNAVWNDYADWFDVGHGIEIVPGKVYVLSKNGTVFQSSQYNQKGIIGIVSDTYGNSVGIKEGQIQLPISIAGYVLAYVEEEYEPGTPLTSYKKGSLIKMNRRDVILYPERIIATYLRKEKSVLWNNIEVKNRHWVKVK